MIQFGRKLQINRLAFGFGLIGVLMGIEIGFNLILGKTNVADQGWIKKDIVNLDL